MDPKSSGDTVFTVLFFRKGPRPLTALAFLFPRGVQDLQVKDGGAFMECSCLVPYQTSSLTCPCQPWCSRPSSINKILPSLMSLSSRPDVLGREVQVTPVIVPKLTLRPQPVNCLKLPT